MAERKSGPVKPPVIDGTAREAAAKAPVNPASETAVTPPPPESKSETLASKPAETPKPAETIKADEKPKLEPTPSPASAGTAAPQAASPVEKPMPARSPWPAAAAGMVGGAILGVAIAYGLANAGFWPSSPPAIDPRLAAIEQRLNATTDTAQTAISDIAAVSARSDAAESSLASLSAAVDSLKSVAPPDLSGIQASIKTLSDRLDAIAAGASSADAGALAANLSRTEASLADLTGKVTALSQEASQSGNAVEALTGELDNVKTALATEAQRPSPEATMAPALRLPLVLSGLEAAFSSGRPFSAELESLKQILPQTEIPAPVAAAAADGLVQPTTLVERFNAALPDILAASPPNPDAPWNEAALGWLKSVLVLRPSGDVAGDSPDAIVARLENAMTAGDFAAAAPLFAKLPEPMRQAAGTIPQDAAALAAADAFIADLRTSALSSTGVTQ
jgi:hypothetical protein